MKKKKKLNSLKTSSKPILPVRSLSMTATTTTKTTTTNLIQILPLQEHFINNTAVLMFKVRMGLSPQLLCDLNRLPARYGSHNSVLPRTRTDLSKKSFAFSESSILELSSSENKTFKSVRGLKINLCKVVTLKKMKNMSI